MRKFSLSAVLLGALLVPAVGRAAPIFFFGANAYEVIVAPGIDWNSANAAALASSFAGITGHLATLTSAAEDSFAHFVVRAGTPGINTTGGFAGSELWVGGFQLPGSVEPGAGWTWVNAEGGFPGNNLGPAYANWLGGEPNNVGAGEDMLAIGLNNQFGWNDEANLSGIHGYIIEYEGGATVPEPATLALFGMSWAGLGAIRAIRRRRRKSPA